MEAVKIDILELAKFLILYFKETEISISNTKLQKILYYIQAWHLVFCDQHPLFDDEPEAWVRGPVYRTVYNSYDKLLASTEVENYNNQLITNLDISAKQEEVLQRVIDHYGTMSTDKLIYLTHAEKPWNEAREGYSIFAYCDKTITHENMYIYYNERKMQKEKKTHLSHG